MKLQKNTRLALFSVLEFASDPTRHIAAGEIAQRYGVSSDVVSLFEDLGGDPSRREEGDDTPVGRALAAVLSEIDEIAKATFSTITLATMLRLIERQRAEVSARPGAARAARASSARRAP